MGCCFSSSTNGTTATSKTDQKNQNPPKPHHSPLKPPILQAHKTPPPPPPEEEEETVIKEVLVLSETPVGITQTHITQPPPKTQTVVSSPIKKQQEQQEQLQEQENSDRSQLSEIYSISETISTTTTKTTTATTATAPKSLKEDEATSKENSDVKHKSPAKVLKKRPSNGDPGSVRARRDPLPEKRARGRGRRLGELRTMQRNAGSRSRSPGAGRARGVGMGAVGQSTTAVTGKTDSKPVGAVTMEVQSKREEDGNGDMVEQQQPDTESLENPLVSLECFIFL